MNQNPKIRNKYDIQIDINPQITLKTNKEEDPKWFQIYYKKKKIGHIVIEKEYKFNREETKEMCAIWDFRIDESKRRKKIGKTIYNYIEKEYFKPKCNEITLNATPDGRPFWEKMGFKHRYPQNPQSESMIKKFRKD